MIILRSKKYSDNGGMSTTKKIGLGLAATGAAFMGAKSGMLGANLMKSSNNLIASAGQKIGSQAMVNSGARGMAKADALKAGTNKGLVQNAMNYKAQYAIPKPPTT